MASAAEPGRVADEQHALNVERTLKELQRMVREHEAALSQLAHGEDAAVNPYSDARRSAKAALDVMAEAYEGLTNSEPFLPFQNSVLPALLALQRTHATIAESKLYLESKDVSLDTVRRRLEVEEANLSDQKALNLALKRRMQSLRDGLETRKDMTPNQVFKEKLDKLKQEKKAYDQQTSTLLKDLRHFIKTHLGAMLAAEELGGPVVGDMMEIDTEDLEAGFNAQGKKKKAKASGDLDKRQQRIDQIWGGNHDNPGLGNNRKQSSDEASAAADEMQDLTEELLNTLSQSGGNTSASYVKLPRESAAARFLVRSKVAQFHPKDATLIRLIDFGQELDD